MLFKNFKFINTILICAFLTFSFVCTIPSHAAVFTKTDKVNCIKKMRKIASKFKKIKSSYDSKEAFKLLFELHRECENFRRRQVSLVEYLAYVPSSYFTNISDAQIDSFEKILIFESHKKRVKEIYLSSGFTNYESDVLFFKSHENIGVEIPFQIELGLTVSVAGLLLYSLPEESLSASGFIILETGGDLLKSYNKDSVEDKFPYDE